MNKIYIGLITILFMLSVAGQTVIYKRDYSEAKKGTETYKGCQAKKFDKRYSLVLGRIQTKNIKPSSKLTLKLDLAVTDGATALVKGICFKGRKKAGVFSIGRYKKSEEYKTFTGNFSLDRKLKKNAEGVTSILLLVFRVNKKGTIWIKSVELTAPEDKPESETPVSKETTSEEREESRK